MKNSICTIVLLLVALFLTSCEKDELLVEDTFTPTQIVPAELPSNTQIDTSKSIEILVEANEISSRSTEELLLEETIELGRDDWYAPFIEKDRMEAGCSYRMSVTTTAGQTQAYLLGFRNGDFRNLSATPDVEDNTVTLTGTSEDLQDTETRMYFAVHSAQGARFDIAIHKICEEVEAEVFNPENISINIQNASDPNDDEISYLQDVYIEVEIDESQAALVDYVELSYKLAGDEAYRFIRREDQAPYEWGKPHSPNDYILNHIITSIEIRAEIRLLSGDIYYKNELVNPKQIPLKTNLENGEIYKKNSLQIEITVPNGITLDRVDMMFYGTSSMPTQIAETHIGVRTEFTAPYTWNMEKDEHLRNLPEGGLYYFQARGYSNDKLVTESKTIYIYIDDSNIDCSLGTGIGNILFCSTFPSYEGGLNRGVGVLSLKQHINPQEGGGRCAFRYNNVASRLNFGSVELYFDRNGITGFNYTHSFEYKNSSLEEGDLVEIYINPYPNVPSEDSVRVFINGREHTMIGLGLETAFDLVTRYFTMPHIFFTELCIETGIPFQTFEGL